MQMVILAGGLGTRLTPFVGDIPKSMVAVDGKPFIERQLRLFKSHGFHDIVLCLGRYAEQIEERLGDGSRLGLRVQYSHDGEPLLGTAGAVRKAEGLLADEFFLAYGDSYMPLDYADALAHFRLRRKLGLMVVYRNDDRYDRSNVIVEGGLVRVYDKEVRHPEMKYINYGVSVLRRDALSLIPEGTPYSQEEWYQDLIAQGQLASYETRERFYEIGSPGGLEEFRSLVAAGVVA